MHNKHPRTDGHTLSQPVLLLAVLLCVVAALVVWAESGNYRALVKQQQELARQSVSLVSTELNAYLANLQRTSQVLLQNRHHLVKELTVSPGNDSLHDRLNELLGNYHDEHQAFALADAQGQILYEATGNHLDPVCKRNLQKLAHDPLAPALTLHAANTPYHLDVLQRIKLPDGAPGVLLVSYNPRRMARLLDQGAAQGHRLFMVNSKQPDQIELSAEGARDVLQHSPQLSATEQAAIAQYGASATVGDSQWLLLNLPDMARLKTAARDGWIRGSALLISALLLGLFTLNRIRREERRRQGAEQALLEAHAELENKVTERTQALSSANSELAAQVTRRQHAEERMSKLSRAVEYTGDSIIISDPDGIIEYVNPAFEHMMGRPADTVLGTPLADLQTAHQPSEFMRRLWQHLDKEQAFREIFCTRNATGEACYTEQTITPLRDDKEQITQLIATGKDITERMDSEQRLSYLAHHDTLTGLPNRALMFDRLGHALARANRNNTLVALLFMDIDRFKTINDSLGHQAGDELLIAVAQRLDKSVRRSDSIARLGGDEFVAILEDIRQTEEPVHVAKSILNAIAEPLTLAGQEVSVTSSIGIALYPEDAGDANTLLQCADTAMYRAKAEGGNTYNFYTADMTAEAQRRLRLESRLRKALENQEFCLRYQPRLDFSSRRITAVEALLRWQPPGEHMLSPADFMLVLEETGLIRRVGEWVLQQACTDFGHIKAAGHQLRIACNLSAKQFRDEDLVEIIDRTVLDQAMQHTDLELELTENLLTGNIEHTAKVLTALHERGVRISVDDFGTGYSSLTCLKRFPIDDLKVDNSFVRNLNDDKEDASIVAAIISLAHSLGLGAVAEGVETQAQLQTLGLLGCDEAQGLLLSAPLPIDELLKWLNAHRNSFV